LSGTFSLSSPQLCVSFVNRQNTKISHRRSQKTLRCLCQSHSCFSSDIKTHPTHFSNRISVKLFRTSVHCWW